MNHNQNGVYQPQLNVFPAKKARPMASRRKVKKNLFKYERPSNDVVPARFNSKRALHSNLQASTESNVSNFLRKATISSKKTSPQKDVKLLKKLIPFLRPKFSSHVDRITRLRRLIHRPLIYSRICDQQTTTRLSSLYDARDSLLESITSYRLTRAFSARGKLVTSIKYAHNICPNQYICLPDVIGTCTDKSCLYQHKSNYYMGDIDKLADILSYKPSLTGFKSDPDLSPAENMRLCRLKLREYAARLLAKNHSNKPVETIAQNLLKYIRTDKSDLELLTLTRKLPKNSHVICNSCKGTGITGLAQNAPDVDGSVDTENDDKIKTAAIYSLTDRLLALKRSVNDLIDGVISVGAQQDT